MISIARYDDIREISRDPERFCSSMGVLVNDPMRTWEKPAKARRSCTWIRPITSGFRKLVNREFTPRAIVDARAADPRARTRRARSHAGLRRVRLRRPGGRAVPGARDRRAARDPRRRPARLPALVRRDDRGDRQAAGGDARGPDASSSATSSEHIAAKKAHPATTSCRCSSTPRSTAVPLDRDELLIFFMALLVAGNETTRT